MVIPPCRPKFFRMPGLFEVHLAGPQSKAWGVSARKRASSGAQRAKVGTASAAWTRASLVERSVHTESQRQTHLQECLRQDTRGMRGKARGADKDDESGNRGDEKGSKERLTHRGATTNGRPSKIASEEAKSTITLVNLQLLFFHLQLFSQLFYNIHPIRISVYSWICKMISCGS